MVKDNKQLSNKKTIITNPDFAWLDEELNDCEFPDERLRARFFKLIKKLWAGVGKPIPLACEDWANTKAAYRFFSNDRMTEEAILQGHFQATKNRFLKTKDMCLILHDTTEFSYKRVKPEKIGITKSLHIGQDPYGKPKHFTKCGLLMHSSLLVTQEGLPLGLSAVKFWTRKQFKGTNALKNHVNPTRISIEKKESYRWLENIAATNTLFKAPERCVHIGDRESDIFELFCQAQKLNTHFLVRTCVDRLAGDGGHTIAKEMDEVKVKGLHTVELVDKKGVYSKIKLELKYRRLQVLPPIGKQRQYPNLTLTVLHASEKNPPEARKAITWKLMTDLAINSRQEAIEKLDWYAMRWKIETFHKILKSGCRAEESKLRAAERLSKLMAVYCILSWRIFWLTQMNRYSQNMPGKIAFTSVEMKLLEKLIPDKKQAKKKKVLSDYLTKLAMLGGYLARNSDPPPGNMVMWRGLSKLIDIQLGFNMALEICG